MGDKSPDDSSVLGSVVHSVHSSEVNKEVKEDVCRPNGFLEKKDDPFCLKVPPQDQCLRNFTVEIWGC